MQTVAGAAVVCCHRRHRRTMVLFLLDDCSPHEKILKFVFAVADPCKQGRNHVRDHPTNQGVPWMRGQHPQQARGSKDETNRAQKLEVGRESTHTISTGGGAFGVLGVARDRTSEQPVHTLQKRTPPSIIAMPADRRTYTTLPFLFSVGRFANTHTHARTRSAHAQPDSSISKEPLTCAHPMACAQGM